MEQLTKAAMLSYALKARTKLHHIYLHWTAGSYGNVFPDYHLCIKGDGSVYATTPDWTEVLSHTWYRNTGALGIALCCAYGAQLFADGRMELGDYPPTPAQVESVSLLLAYLGPLLNIPLAYPFVMTHAEAADVDGYGPEMAGTPQFEKWDLWKLLDYDGTWKNGGDVLRGKAVFYQNLMV